MDRKTKQTIGNDGSPFLQLTELSVVGGTVC